MARVADVDPHDDRHGGAGGARPSTAARTSATSGSPARRAAQPRQVALEQAHAAVLDEHRLVDAAVITSPPTVAFAACRKGRALTIVSSASSAASESRVTAPPVP